MEPIYFASGNTRCYGVYHRAATRPASVARPTELAKGTWGVVVCPPLGQEYARCHKLLQLLSSQLARQGIHVLRFDYRGTGDSEGDLTSLRGTAPWQEDIQAAIAELQSRGGCESVMVLGLRAGANLARAVALGNPAIHSLILWEPIACGKIHLQRWRQMQAELRDLWPTRLPRPDDTAGEELAAARYPASLLADIAQWDDGTGELLQPRLIVRSESDGGSESPAVPVLTTGVEQVLTLPAMGDWYALGEWESLWWNPAAVTMLVQKSVEMFQRLEAREWFAAHATWSQELQRSAANFSAGAVVSPPVQVLSSGTMPPRLGVPRTPSEISLSPAFATPLFADNESVTAELPRRFSRPASVPKVELPAPPYRETAWQAGGLAGVLTEPRSRNANSAAPIFVVLNAGIVHHVGPFRLHVLLARELAEQGFTTLRVDLSGLGDSSWRTGNATRPERILADLREVFEQLQTTRGSDRFVLVGLCSGAYHLHQVAVKDRRVVGMVSLDGIGYRTRGYYWRAQIVRRLRWRFWRNALKRRWLKWRRGTGGEAAANSAGHKLAEAEFFANDQAPAVVARELRDLRLRGTDMLFVYTGGCEEVCGVQQFQEMFGIAPDKQTQVEYYADCEHTFHVIANQQKLLSRIRQWAQDRYPRD